MDIVNLVWQYCELKGFIEPFNFSTLLRLCNLFSSSFFSTHDTYVFDLLFLFLFFFKLRFRRDNYLTIEKIWSILRNDRFNISLYVSLNVRINYPIIDSGRAE